MRRHVKHKTSRTAAESAFAARDVAAEMARWLGHLGAERRMSAKTVEAYERDVRQFLAFLAEHLGGAPTLAELAKLDAAGRARLHGGAARRTASAAAR